MLLAEIEKKRTISYIGVTIGIVHACLAINSLRYENISMCLQHKTINRVLLMFSLNEETCEIYYNMFSPKCISICFKCFFSFSLLIQLSIAKRFLREQHTFKGP
jgi:hypothetical protein